MRCLFNEADELAAAAKILMIKSASALASGLAEQFLPNFRLV